MRAFAGLAVAFCLVAPAQAALTYEGTLPAEGQVTVFSPELGSGVYLLTLSLDQPGWADIAMYDVESQYEYDRVYGTWSGDSFERWNPLFSGPLFGTMTWLTKVQGSVRYVSDSFIEYESHAGNAYALIAAPSQTTYRFTVDKIGEVPEPATWALTILGFGLAGLRLRRTYALRQAA